MRYKQQNKQGIKNLHFMCVKVGDRGNMGKGREKEGRKMTE